VTRAPKLLRFIAPAVWIAVAGACAKARLPDLEPGDRRAFRASSVHTQFFIVGEFEGVAEVWKDSILVLVTRGRIDTRGSPDDDVLLRVALATGDTAARWRVGDASSAAPLPRIRRDEAGNLVETVRFSLKRPARPLYDYWLAFVFEVEGRERAPDGRPLLHTAFAHSQPDVFAARRDAGDSQP
jgi:hypothetical protein